MDPSKFFFRLFLVDKDGNPARYLGSAFAVAPNGGLLTCRHVVDVDYDRTTHRLAVLDTEIGLERWEFKCPGNPVYASSTEHFLDIAFLPNALGRPKESFLPIIEPQILAVGQNVYTYGFRAPGDKNSDTFLSGSIANKFVSNPDYQVQSWLLPYPIIEGMSGSPVMTDYNGPKVAGLAYGNQMQRIVAREAMDYKDTEREYKETIYRVVEFGLAYHPLMVVNFLREIGIPGVVVSEQYVAVSGLG